MYFEKWYPVDLVRLPAHIQDVGMTLFVGDADSIRIGVNVTRDGAEETVTGAVKGIVILPDGSDILPFNGSSDGSRAWIDLPGTALVMSGRVQIALRVYDDGAVTTLLAVSATVRRADADRHFDPDDVVGDITELISEAERVSGVAETAAAQAQDALEQASNIVSYAAQSGQTDDQKAAARQNIGAVSEAALSLLTARVDALHGLVDYDYGTPYSGTWTAGMTVTRIDTRLTFDGKSPSANGVPLYFKLNGTVTTGNKNSTATLDDEGLVLKAGHKYRFRLLVRGGSYSSWAPTSALQYPIYPRVYKYGDMGDVFYNFTYLPDGMSSFVDFDYQDSYNGVYPCIMINRRSGGNAALFDNVEIEAVIEDITNGIHELPAPTVDGTYVLKCTVTNGVPTFSWVSEGSGLLGTPLTGGDTE